MPGTKDHIFDWTAARSGGTLTITGKVEGGKPRKLTNIEYIVCGPNGPVAVDHKGHRYDLAQRCY